MFWKADTILTRQGKQVSSCILSVQSTEVSAGNTYTPMTKITEVSNQQICFATACLLDAGLCQDFSLRELACDRCKEETDQRHNYVSDLFCMAIFLSGIHPIQSGDFLR